MKMRRMRVESLVINIKVLIVLFVLWYLLCDNCCVKVAGEVVSEYVFLNGLATFAGISFTANTTIAISWITKHLTDWIDKYIQKKCQEYCDDKTNDVRELYVTETYKMERHFCSRLGSIMKMPNRVYSVIGLLSSLYIAYLMYSGIPSSLSRFIVLMPFPAIAYYSVALLAYFSIRVQINGDFCDKYEEADELSRIARAAVFSAIETNAKSARKSESFSSAIH